jgi:hypothetical protein
MMTIPSMLMVIRTLVRVCRWLNITGQGTDDLVVLPQ